MNRNFLSILFFFFLSVFSVEASWEDAAILSARLPELESLLFVGSFSEEECALFVSFFEEVEPLFFLENRAEEKPTGQVLLEKISEYAKEFPNKRHDLMLVDLNGDFRLLLKTLFALQGLAHERTLVLFKVVEGSRVHLPVWERCREKGVLEELGWWKDSQGGCWREGRYLFHPL